MDTKIYTLNCYNERYQGHATLTALPNGITVGFSVKAPPERLTCLYCEDKVYPCGNITPSNRRIQTSITAKGARPSFGVFNGTKCVLHFGTKHSMDKMQGYLETKNGDNLHDHLTYYNKNKDFFYSLLGSSPNISHLECLMPGSRWARIPDGCILGLIKDEKGNILYICYGIEGRRDQQVPKELAPYCKWLDDRKEGCGWWTIYQCPKTGEALKI